MYLSTEAGTPAQTEPKIRARDSVTLELAWHGALEQCITDTRARFALEGSTPEEIDRTLRRCLVNLPEALSETV